MMYFIKVKVNTMKRTGIVAAILLAAVIIFSACVRQQEYFRHSAVMTDYFDTVITLVAYTRTEDEFQKYAQLAEARFTQLHQFYDIYNSYEGINNIKTVNDMAGIEAVAVHRDILDLVKLAKEWTLSGQGKTNIALGPVLEVWHRCRTEGIADPENARLPSQEELTAAAAFTDSSKIIIDEQEGTIFLAERHMRLDVGAIAKGYATELVARELQAAGLESGAISAGGNVRTIGGPRDGNRDRWAIGISDPDAPIFSNDRSIDIVYINDAAVVTSGDYQRYYYVGGRRYHHLIDPDTLMPANYYRALTVVTPDSGLADLLSTELFLSPYEESRALAESLEDVEVLWIMPDGEIRVTEGLNRMLRSYGATGRD
ncbi:MAG TPA: FAD:protein FMN transferase [Bacillota bacterium]|jgi:thiamine biosynthesis lipoprotein|nr:FAD:protein FMN transferase [Bacillota bacterium]HQD19790.1 FAD:protein FMN transferase [Bacillota bacterium]